MNETSIKKLNTCHDDLIRLAHAVNQEYPIQVICGERNERDQNEAFIRGASKKKFPESKHNINFEKRRFKSHAMDIVPDPDRNPKTLDWRDLKAFSLMMDTVKKKADELEIKVRFGRAWGDWPHVELV